MDISEESFDEDSFGVQALQVDLDENELDLNMPPTTGSQYLRRVRMEASQCPQTVVANVDTGVFKNKQTVHVKQWIGAHQPAPSGFAPSLKWQNMQVANFAQQRQKLAQHKAERKRLKVAKLPSVPHANDVQAWCRLCFGRLNPPARAGVDMATSKPPSDLPGSTEEPNSSPHLQDRKPPSGSAVQDDVTFPQHEGILPLVSLVVAMDQMTVLKVLEYHLNWFEVTGFTEKQGYWFYALLASLDKPLSPDACSLLRDMARAFSRLRAALDHAEDPRLIPLNLFICLIARYFDQSDLKDDVT